MASTLHFPNAETMTKYLSQHETIATSYFVEKGITKAIAELAAERFADSDKVEMGIKMGTMLMVNDLRTGEDGFSGKKITKIDLPDMMWSMLSMSIEKALIDCAKNAS